MLCLRRVRGGVSVAGVTRGTYQGLRYPYALRAHSSAGERSLHTREVPGSIPGAPIRYRLPMRKTHLSRGQVCHRCRLCSPHAPLCAPLIGATARAEIDDGVDEHDERVTEIGTLDEMLRSGNPVADPHIPG